MARHCPDCGKTILSTGRGPEWMNSEQWDASKAGDDYATCERATHPNGNCYFWRDGTEVRRAGSAIKAAEASA